MSEALRAATLRVPEDPVAAWEYFYERGWCDGLPIVPPTPERVEAMLGDAAQRRQTVVARMPPSHTEVTLEQIAINAVMAGCLPGVAPALAAAAEAISRPEFRLLPMGTPPATPFMLFNGPVRDRLRLNCGYAALAGVTRSNTTLGRALRLLILNAGLGGLRTVPDQCTLGMPTRISFCLGENEEANPWEPLHVARGFSRGDSTLTVLNVVSPVNIVDQDAKSAQALLITLAGSMTMQGSNNMSHDPGEPMLLLGRNHAVLLAREGLSRADVQRQIWERAWIPFEAFNRDNQESMRNSGRPVTDGRVYLTRRPEDLQIAVAGGPAGPHSQFYTTLGRAITVPVA